MREAFNVINKIANTSGRIDKENILLDNKDNELLKDILHFTYNPYIVTGLSKKKISKKTKETTLIKLNSINEAMDYLQRNNTGKDFDIANIQDFISRQDSELQDFLTQVFTNSLKIGVTSKTLNKIYGDFIPEFNVMLAEKYFDYADKINEGFIISEKLDGNRIILIKDNDSVKAFTRQGQAYEGLVEIEDEARYLENGVYDGELIALNPDKLNSADLYRLTTSIVRKDGIKKGVIFNVFDMLPIEDFKKGECKICCVARKENLNKILNGLNLDHIVEVPTLYIGEDKDQITYWLDKLTSEGKEGCMVNIASAPYRCKRNKGILKVKKMQSADCEIVGFEEGTGKNQGTLGAAIIDYKGNFVKVGSGYSDEDRSYIWNNQNELLGRIIEVQYFEESTNKKDDSVSLRFPVFKTVREEGKEISYY